MDDARCEDVPRNRLVNAVKRRLYAHVDAMLVPAPSHLPTCRWFGVPAERVFYGVDVVDNDAWANWTQQCRASGNRTIRGAELPERYFLGVGRQVPIKNWPGLLRAYAAHRNAAADGPWDLVLVGDGPERNELESYVRQQGVPGVHFLPMLPPTELAIAYAHAGCVVLPSFNETWGLVVNEAMACGVPVLVSETCGCVETLVESGSTGWTFSPRSTSEMAAALARLA